jgi:hypothetical protein
VLTGAPVTFAIVLLFPVPVDPTTMTHRRWSVPLLLDMFWLFWLFW